jgi:alpha-L-fucosidase 2
VPVSVKVVSEKGGSLKMKLPFKTWLVKNIPPSAIQKEEQDLVSVNLKKGQSIIFENAHQ